MTHVYTLKIRYSGEEDEVFVFSTRKKAEAQVFAYFDMQTSTKTFSELTNWLFRDDIGYFDIEHQKIN